MIRLKTIFLITAAFSILGCSTQSDKPKNNKPQDPIREHPQEKKHPEPLTTLYCQNELQLLTDPRSNWKVPLDTIQTIDDYIANCRIERDKPYAKIDPSTLPDRMDSILKYDNDEDILDQIFKGTNPHPNIHPFIFLDSVKISLMQLLRPSGAGYFGNSHDQVRISIYKDPTETQQTWTDSVQRFYTYYIPWETYKSHEWNRLQGPMISLGFDNPGFSKIESAIRAIVAGYIKALRTNAYYEFHEQLCQLNPTQLHQLKQKYPLKIRLMKIR